MLNARRPLKKDFRGLAKLIKYTETKIKEFDQVENPTYAILADWRSQNERTGDHKTNVQ